MTKYVHCPARGPRERVVEIRNNLNARAVDPTGPVTQVKSLGSGNLSFDQCFLCGQIMPNPENGV